MTDEILDTEIYTEDIELDDFIEVDDNDMQVEYTYPCALLEGVQTEYEVEYLAKYTCDESASLPLYIKYGDIVTLMGRMELTSRYLMNLDFIDSDKTYSIKLLLSANEEKLINLRDSETLLKLIKL